jgi:hypothetical protein
VIIRSYMVVNPAELNMFGQPQGLHLCS